MTLIEAILLLNVIAAFGVLFDGMNRDAPWILWFTITLLSGILGALLYVAVVVND